MLDPAREQRQGGLERTAAFRYHPRPYSSRRRSSRRRRAATAPPKGREAGPFVESEQIWALSRKILLYGPERPFTAQVFIKKEILVGEQINSAKQS